MAVRITRHPARKRMTGMASLSVFYFVGVPDGI